MKASLAQPNLLSEYSPLSASRKYICEACGVEFPPNRGTPSRFCSEHRTLKGERKEVVNYSELIKFITTPGNGSLTFKSGSVMLISGDRRVSADTIFNAYRQMKKELNNAKLP